MSRRWFEFLSEALALVRCRATHRADSSSAPSLGWQTTRDFLELQGYLRGDHSRPDRVLPL